MSDEAAFPSFGSTPAAGDSESTVHPVGCGVYVGIHRFDFIFIYAAECDAERTAVDRYGADAFFGKQLFAQGFRIDSVEAEAHKIARIERQRFDCVRLMRIDKAPYGAVARFENFSECDFLRLVFGIGIGLHEQRLRRSCAARNGRSYDAHEFFYKRIAVFVAEIFGSEGNETSAEPPREIFFCRSVDFYGKHVFMDVGDVSKKRLLFDIVFVVESEVRIVAYD